MYSKFSRQSRLFISSAAFLPCVFLTFGTKVFAQDYPVVQMIKRNASSFAIDGNNGGANGQEVYLYSEDEDNRNQQWYEIDRGNGYYTYQKVGTDFCIDGGNGGERQQSVYLWSCRANNQNQHWLKVDVGSGNYRLQKRNASDFSIDGKGGGESRQTLHLWNSSDGNQNQHWTFNYVSGEDNNNAATVNSLDELRVMIQSSNQNIVMASGRYNILDLPTGSRNLNFSGSNNTIDMSNVYIEVPVGSTERASYITMEGSNNNLVGGEFEDVYTNGMSLVTDFVSYNDDGDLSYGLRGAAVFNISGENNTIDGLKLTVRGSFPYGYGSIFGIGAGNTFGLSKRCGIVINGPDNTLDNVEVQMRSFCHGIYMQGDADNTLIRNALVEGRIRETNDMLDEGSGSLPARNNYLDVDGNAILPNEANSLSEDGIRSYSGTGSVRVENSVVRRMRGGFRLYLGSDATVINSTAVDCGNTNFNLPSGGEITGSTGNFTYAPLSDFRLSRSRQEIDVTILPSPNAIGSHNIADVLGNDHDIIFRRADGPEDTGENRVIRVYGNNSTIRNETEYRIVLESGTSGNTVISAGDVTDNGSNNVSFISLDL